MDVSSQNLSCLWVGEYTEFAQSEDRQVQYVCKIWTLVRTKNLSSLGMNFGSLAKWFQRRQFKCEQLMDDGCQVKPGELKIITSLDNY